MKKFILILILIFSLLSCGPPEEICRGTLVDVKFIEKTFSSPGFTIFYFEDGRRVNVRGILTGELPIGKKIIVFNNWSDSVTVKVID